MNQGIRIAVVGLGFGSYFVPIYLQHPMVEQVAICDSDQERLNLVGDKFGVEQRFSDLEEILRLDEFDAVHLLTGIPQHAEQSVAVLESGKHCACAVPMATSIEDLHAIVKAQKYSGKNYMMMETAVYTRQFLYVQSLLDSGEMGQLQFLRGAHYQDMEGWAPYWKGLPPMHYATHAISPLLALAKTRAESVRCLGSGRMRAELVETYQNPYPIETAIFQLAGTDVAAEVTRSLFETAILGVESFWALGEQVSFEWGRDETELPVLYRIEPLGVSRYRNVDRELLDAPDYANLLPSSIGRFTTPVVYDESNPERSFLVGGDHHGSHPHLVHEFVMSIVENRKPAIDAVKSADWTAAGICAHESAMMGGEIVKILSFD